MRIVHTSDADGLAPLRAEFAAANPGCALEWKADVQHVDAVGTRIAFVQDGAAEGSVGEACAPLWRGDAVCLRPGEALRLSAPQSLLVFDVPAPLSADVPTFLRPDHDPQVTDTPGGCAEEGGAYRRILLTWEGRNGPYTYRALNCHRVRMINSFSHYHPKADGFDELYLVQGVTDGARLYTSRQVARIEARDATRDDARALVEEHRLRVGDLVYLPRGTMHRAVGGVLAQVITTPGFKPGCEIGLDHHLRALNDALGLTGEEALPFQQASSDAAVVK